MREIDDAIRYFAPRVSRPCKDNGDKKSPDCALCECERVALAALRTMKWADEHYKGRRFIMDKFQSYLKGSS